MTPADAMLYLVIAASIAILVYVKIGKRDSRGQVWSEPQSLDRLNITAHLELGPVLYWAHSI